MRGGIVNPGYPASPAFFSNPIYYLAYNIGNPGYYGAFGNPPALYAPNLYGYPYRTLATPTAIGTLPSLPATPPLTLTATRGAMVDMGISRVTARLSSL